MDIQTMAVTQSQAMLALDQYRKNRSIWDKNDIEIAKIYRAISRGALVISANEAIIRGGVDEQGRPRIAIMRADQDVVICDYTRGDDTVIFRNRFNSKAAEWYFQITWPGRRRVGHYRDAQALLPRIPPQHRPKDQGSYHLLWEADWTDIPHDPALLKRIGKDAWVVMAVWDLTAVEMAVLRARR